jgi:hypothetical protein
MATKHSNQKNRTADAMRTKNGKERLGPLSVPQLEKMLEGARKKHKPQIVKRIALMKTRPNYKAPVVVVEEATAVA